MVSQEDTRIIKVKKKFKFLKPRKKVQLFKSKRRTKMRDKNLPLHLKYRPQNFSEIIGNETTVDSLKVVLSRETGGVRSFLLTGPSGCGKTTVARIIAKDLNCSERDFNEFNSANVRGIDSIREIAESCRYSPLFGKVKIYLLDEAGKLTGDAQYALLKLLEDTPKHVRFILCTTDPEKLIKTIRTRCSTFQFSLLRRNQILKLLKWICEEEKVKLSEKVLLRIADYCDGCPRQAVVMLDQVIDIVDEELSLQTLMENGIDEPSILDLCQKLLGGAKWEVLAGVLRDINDEPEKVRYAVLTYMSKVLLSKSSDRAANIIDLFSNSFMYSGKAGLILAVYLVSKL